MKVDSKIFKGIEYVQLSELPQIQQDLLLQTIDHNLFIKILIDGKVLNQCLQYKHYDHWFENVYKGKEVLSKDVRVAPAPVVSVKTDLALNKA